MLVSMQVAATIREGWLSREVVEVPGTEGGQIRISQGRSYHAPSHGRKSCNFEWVISLLAGDAPLVFPNRANVAHVRQPRPDSGHGFQVQVLNSFKVAPSSLGSGQEAL